MAFDGVHALSTGDFVTPSSGPHAGQLGPWTLVPRSLGLEPRSVSVKAFFLLFGLIYLLALAAFLLRRKGSWYSLVGCAIIALLYLPVGTLTSIASLVVLVTLRPNHRAPKHW
jgi:hypothetical protein